MASVLKKASAFVKDFKAHWNVPYKGRSIPNKEIAAYGIGGMGVHFVSALSGVVALSASNFLVGSCIGLKPMDLQIMLIVANIIGLGITAVREYIFDNVKSPMGKFRPFLKWMGIPTVIISLIFVWVPYENISSYIAKAVIVEVLYLLINCFSPFYFEAFSTLVQVMSPDSDERTDVMSISQIIYSLAPTVINLIIPFLAQLTGGLLDIKTYRIIYPIIGILGIFISFPVYKGTRERIVKPKSQENEIRFFDAIRSIVKNKYFWIINSAGWIGFLESAYAVILTWTIVYGHPEQEKYLGVANTLIGNGALWAMMAAPFLIRALGKRNLLIWCNVANIFLLALLYPFFENIWIVIAVFYANNFVSVLGNIYNPGINADMKDYQQYITGERIDGMFGVVGMIGTVIGFATGLVVPAIYEKCGLHTDYDVLFNADVRNPLFKMLIICSVIGAILNVIPFLFYDLTEKKHKGIINVLRIRTMFDDYGHNNLSDDTLVEAMAIIERAESVKGENKIELSKSEIEAARKLRHKTAEEKAIISKQKAVRREAMKRTKDILKEIKKRPKNVGSDKAERKQAKALRNDEIKKAKSAVAAAKYMPKKIAKEDTFRYAEIKKAKEIYKATKLRNLDIDLAPMVFEELAKYNTERYQFQYKISKFIVSEENIDLAEIKKQLEEKYYSMKDTKGNKEIKNDLKKLIRKFGEAIRLRGSFYPNGIIAPDPKELEEAQKMPTNSIVKALKRRKVVKAILKEKSIYKRAMFPITNAEATVIEEKSYKCMDDLKEKYHSLELETV